MARSGPTIRSQWLGQQLRELREEAGLRLKHAGEHLEREISTVSRYESGEYPLRKVDLRALLDLYGVSEPAERDHLLALNEEAWQKGWWDGFSDVIDRKFIDYTWLETRARRVHAYETVLVPGLLQTRRYAEVVNRRIGGEFTESEIQRFVALRMERQAVWAQDQEKCLSVIIDESVLRRTLGKVDVLREQLEHLRKAAQQPQTEVLILPFNAPSHAGTDGAFTVFEPTDPYPAVGYLETLSGRVFAESGRVERFLHVYADLHKISLSAAESVARIATVLEELPR